MERTGVPYDAWLTRCLPEADRLGRPGGRAGGWVGRRSGELADGRLGGPAGNL